MAKALVINRQVKLSLYDIIRFQINQYCFVNKVRLSPAQQDCLALLGLYGEINLSDFCEQVVTEEIFGNVQTARNFVTKCVKEKLVKRSGLGNKLVSLSDTMEVLTKGTILLNLKVFHVETNEGANAN
jgi:hypothetical protein